jgi:hypothetical protein
MIGGGSRLRIIVCDERGICYVLGLAYRICVQFMKTKGILSYTMLFMRDNPIPNIAVIVS